MSLDEAGNGQAEARGRLTERVDGLHQAHKDLREDLKDTNKKVDGLQDAVGTINMILSIIGIISAVIWSSPERVRDFVQGLFR